jgi:hypothetical protein
MRNQFDLWPGKQFPFVQTAGYSWHSAGMSREEIHDDFPEITEDDIRAALAFAADFTNGGWRMSA